MSTPARFSGGRNIAMKVPAHLHAETVRFYGEVLKLKELSRNGMSVSFEFGSNVLWIDSVAALSQAEVWLEVVANDQEAAARELASAGVMRCDHIEPLPEGMQAFWVSNPASIIHLVCQEGE